MKIEREKTGPVLIIGGRTYATFKQVEVEVNDVCFMCDLKDECIVQDDTKLLRMLCDHTDTADECWFEEVTPTRRDTVFDIAFEQCGTEACDALCYIDREL